MGYRLGAHLYVLANGKRERGRKLVDWLFVVCLAEANALHKHHPTHLSHSLPFVYKVYARKDKTRPSILTNSDN
jgi:hypothetical protein